MTRVSLKEAYDNKDVVAQIYAIRDIAEGAEDNANSALSTANTASEHVDALVPQVEGAVQNANAASASAQQSATTVETYDTRLTAVEDADTHNVKLDTNQIITGAKTFNVKGDPIIIKAPDIDGNIIPSGNLYAEIDIRDSAGREIAYFIRRHQANGDANVGVVCKHTRLGLSADISAFVTNDGKTYGIAPTPTIDAPSYAIATKGYVESTNEETNNLLHKSADETKTGTLTFVRGDSNPRLRLQRIGITYPVSGDEGFPGIQWVDQTGKALGYLNLAVKGNGTTALYMMVLNSDGTEKSIQLAIGDVKQ